MIQTVIVGRGSKREVIQRERNFQFSKALGHAICVKLGIPEPARPALRGQKSNKRRAGRGKRVSA